MAAEASQLLYEKSGTCLESRSQTVQVLNALTTSHSSGPNLLNVYGNGVTVLSNVPAAQTKHGVVLGIDEAGRGSVIGPMIYGMCYYDENLDVPKELGDSKQLSEHQRETLYSQILENDNVGLGVRVLHASEISRNMFRNYNLNQMSHDAAIELIRSVPIPIRTCYIDTVGNPEYYKSRLEREFPGIDFVVESKADDSYAPCSAASIVAKVVRDRMIRSMQFSEPNLSNQTNFASGYPSDPACKKWMQENSHPVFGFPDVVRFSWAPAKQQLLKDERAVTIKFAADKDNDDDDDEQFQIGQQKRKLKNFLTGNRKRLPYFERRKIDIANLL